LNAQALFDASDAPIDNKALLDSLNLVLNKTTTGEFEIPKTLND